MTTEYVWYEAYHAAILETDWTNMRERLKAAEFEISKRQHVLSMDHGGTPEEQKAIADALKCIKNLQKEVGLWHKEQPSDGGPTTFD